jgi:DUF1016 N-terminal domain
MMQFAEAFPDEEIVATLSRQLSWSHVKELLPLTRSFQREFYAEMSRIEGWSVRTLRERIDSMLYERTALSKQPEALLKQELAILGYGNESVQNGPFGFLSRQVPSRRRRTEVRPMPKRLAISDLVSFSLR